MRIRFELDDGKLIIMEKAVEQMHAYRQTEPRHKEAGGLIIGRFPLQGNHRVVEMVTVPAFMDRRGRTIFFRSWWHNLKLNREWRKSNKTLTLLGTWHTHPEPNPRPSSIDLEDWRNLVSKGTYEGTSLAFLIVGTERINAWIVSQNGCCKQLKDLGVSL